MQKQTTQSCKLANWSIGCIHKSLECHILKSNVLHDVINIINLTSV